MMRVKFLGTGTSSGVPVMGCHCEVCRSADPRDSRLRSSALVDADGTRILIDCGPDFRQQMLHEPFLPLDGILLTHHHYDHIGGLDDVRTFCQFGPVNIYADTRTCQHIRTHMYYCFGNKYPSAPSLQLHEIEPFKPFMVKGTQILPVLVNHGQLPILGFRIGRFAYLTDLKTLPESSVPHLGGLSHLAMGALRHRPHDTHQTLEEAVALSRRLGAAHTHFIHMAHSAGLHSITDAWLPQDITLAYDGMTLEM